MQFLNFELNLERKVLRISNIQYRVIKKVFYIERYALFVEQSNKNISEPHFYSAIL